MMLEVSGLIKILNQQSGLIAELKNLTNEQLQALKQDELEKITAITGQQEYIGRQLAGLEEQRRQLIDDYSGVIGMAVEGLSDLQPYIKNSDWKEIQIYRDEITHNSQAIKQTNELNTLLLKQGLKYAEKMLNLLQPQKPRIYGKSGDINSGGGQTIVDTNV
ncbi:MAG: flagellar protein FlgN [Syntrophomonadaceae bacterium]|nr:flagellar protein FlgN [Syntrophomonadaceae bacterium]